MNNAYLSVPLDARVYRISASGEIAVVAGIGLAGYSGDGGAATKAMLHSPTGIALDASGNLYIADTGNDVIRKVDLASGSISTFAGSRNPKITGDEGTALNAALQAPKGLAFDQSGNYLYVADAGSYRIRQISLSSNVITTVAGNGVRGSAFQEASARASSLTSLSAVSVDQEGNLYLTDGSSIRRVAMRDGISGSMTKIADTGAETFSLALDGTGSLYFGQRSLVGKVALESGAVTNFAGSRAFGFSGDGGMAASAQLAAATGLAADRQGRMWIVDSENLRLRQVNNGVINTIAGNGTRFHSGDSHPGLQGSFGKSDTSLSGISGLAASAGGDLFVYDGADYTVRRLDAATRTLTTIAGQAAKEGPAGDGGSALSARLAQGRIVSVDGEGNVFLLGGATLRQIRAGVITTIAGGGYLFPGAGIKPTDASLGTPSAMVSNASGHLYIATSFEGASYILHFDSKSQLLTAYAGGGSSFVEGGQALSNSLMSVRALALDGEGNLYYADVQNGFGVIRRIDAGGQKIMTVAGAVAGSRAFAENGSALDAVLAAPTALAVDPNGDLYVSDALGILKVSAASGQIRSFAGRHCSARMASCSDAGMVSDATFTDISSLATDARGNVYALDANRVRQVISAPATTMASVVSPAATKPIVTPVTQTMAVASVPRPVTRAAAAPAASVTSGPLHFVPATPCRILDTRNAPGMFGGSIMAAGTQRDIPIPLSSCSIPPNAAAYSVNVTVVPTKILSYLTLWPMGAPQPGVSTLNSFDGDIKANAAIVPAGTNGAISIYVTDESDVILDINGYFVP